MCDNICMLNLGRKKKGQACEWCATKVDRTFTTSKGEQICQDCVNGNDPNKK